MGRHGNPTLDNFQGPHKFEMLSYTAAQVSSAEDRGAIGAQVITLTTKWIWNQVPIPNSGAIIRCRRRVVTISSSRSIYIILSEVAPSTEPPNM